MHTIKEVSRKERRLIVNNQDKRNVRKNAKANEKIIEKLETVASATECTGLIPTPPLSEAEAESYADLCTIPTPENKTPGHLQSIQKSDPQNSSSKQ